jgi:hypothetical protein
VRLVLRDLEGEGVDAHVLGEDERAEPRFELTNVAGPMVLASRRGTPGWRAWPSLRPRSAPEKLLGQLDVVTAPEGESDVEALRRYSRSSRSFPAGIASSIRGSGCNDAHIDLERINHPRG